MSNRSETPNATIRDNAWNNLKKGGFARLFFICLGAYFAVIGVTLVFDLLMMPFGDEKKMIVNAYMKFMNGGLVYPFLVSACGAMLLLLVKDGVQYVLNSSLSYGFSALSLGYARRKSSAGQAYSGFARMYRIFCTFGLRDIYIFLWILPPALLLALAIAMQFIFGKGNLLVEVSTGVVAIVAVILLFVVAIRCGMAYSMVPFIMMDDDAIRANATIRESKRLMDGNRWKLFRMLLKIIWLPAVVFISSIVAFVGIIYGIIGGLNVNAIVEETATKDPAIVSASIKLLGFLVLFMPLIILAGIWYFAAACYGNVATAQFYEDLLDNDERLTSSAGIVEDESVQ